MRGIPVKVLDPAGEPEGYVATITANGAAWAAPPVSSGGGGSGGSGYPPGSADVLPAAPSGLDDEFDGTTTATWTPTPSAPAVDDLARPSHLHLRAAGTGATLVGRYQAAPAAPFTVAAKLASTTGRANYHRAGGLLFLPAGAPTSSTPVVYLGAVFNTSNGGLRVQRTYQTNMGATFQSQAGAADVGRGPIYLRARFTSATVAEMSASVDGWAWVAVETFTLPFAVGNLGVGLSEESAGGGVDAYFDWFRVTV